MLYTHMNVCMLVFSELVYNATFLIVSCVMFSCYWSYTVVVL